VESSLHINPQRLQASIEAYAQIGATPGGGVTRLALTDADRAARDRLQAELEAIGCPVVVDDLGNMTGTLAGREDSPPVRIASHLDSVVRGGRFDGALGVLAGLEVLRTIRDARLAPRRSIALTNWTNEEGARFEPAMIGSGAALGEFDSAWMHDRRDPDGVRLGNELG
jgi:N-carbamoyl-L-amino-acid hydrolase